MENARALDDKLRTIIKEISDSTGIQIKHELLRELSGIMIEQQNREIHRVLDSFNRALKKI